MVYANMDTGGDFANDSKTQDMINYINTLKFQVKYFIYITFCCKNKEVLSKLGEEFEEQKDFYESSVEDIREELTI
jgi:hypothetical protein